jgi:transposase-like protein
MNAESPTPKTLTEAIKHFADYDNAHAFMVQIRWGGNVCCPNCGSERIRYIHTRRQWECREQHPKRRFSLKTGTIMEDSPLPLEKWLAALWLEVNCKNSISSWEAHRALGITQKSAWFMLHRLRHALQSGSLAKMGASGHGCEADETLIGGLAKNMHARKRAARIKGTGASGKTIVMGLLERHTEKKSQVRATVVRDAQASTLHDVIHKHVEPGTPLYTDSHNGYRGLTPTFIHAFINHAEKYVEGNVHTNGMENFWSLFKRCIKGTHVSVEPFHLMAYLDSECFRFNHREHNDGQRFAIAAKGFADKRLTYKALIGASEDRTATSI